MKSYPGNYEATTTTTEANQRSEQHDALGIRTERTRRRSRESRGASRSNSSNE